MLGGSNSGARHWPATGRLGFRRSGGFESGFLPQISALRKGLGPLPARSLRLALGLGLRLLGLLGTAQSCRSTGDGPNDDDMYGAHYESSDMEKS